MIRELKAALKAAIKVEKNARKLSAAKTILVGYKLTALGNKGRSTARITINLAEIPADIYTFGPYDDTPPRWTIVLDARSLSRPERAVLSRIATDPNNGSTLIEFLAYFVDEGFSGEPPAEWGSAVMFVTPEQLDSLVADIAAGGDFTIVNTPFADRTFLQDPIEGVVNINSSTGGGSLAFTTSDSANPAIKNIDSFEVTL